MTDFCWCVHSCATDDCKVGCYNDVGFKSQCEHEYNYCLEANLGNCQLQEYECLLSYIDLICST